MINRGNDIVGHHFYQPDHSIFSILPDKRTRGTATLYGCNDIIIVISILSSFLCSSENMMNTFNSAGERIRSHGHRHYGSSILHAVSLYDIPFIQKPIKTDFFVQLMFGKPRYRPEFKSLLPEEEFEDTKGTIRIRTSTKDRQHNGKKGQTTIYKKYTNN